MEPNHQQTSCHHQGSMPHAPVTFPSASGNAQDAGQCFLMLDVLGVETLYNSAGNSETALGDITGGAGEETERVVYQRMKWTDEMVKILITALTYIEESLSPSTDSVKKGKWKAASAVLAERGFRASPQQCEDKFNDLNKRYKRLNEILGRGTACQIVEHPEYIEQMDLTHEAKEEAKKILNHKQLFFEAMCSYSNQNRLFIPHDPAVQQSVLSVLKGKDKCDAETQTTKRMRPEEQGVLGPNRASEYFPNSTMSFPNLKFTNPINVFNSGQRASSQDGEIISRILHLTEVKLQIQEKILELEKQLLQNVKHSQHEEMKLTKMRLENEAMKLANERLALELRRNEVNQPY